MTAIISVVQQCHNMHNDSPALYDLFMDPMMAMMFVMPLSFSLCFWSEWDWIIYLLCVDLL